MHNYIDLSLWTLIIIIVLYPSITCCLKTITCEFFQGDRNPVRTNSSCRRASQELGSCDLKQIENCHFNLIPFGF